MAEQEWKSVGGEVAVPAKVILEVLEREEDRTEAAPGRLARIRITVRKLARPVPAGFAVEDGLVARMLQGRTIEVQEGFLVGDGGHIVAAYDAKGTRGFFGPGGTIGCPPGSRRFSEPQDLFAAVLSALEGAVFTVGEVEIFASDRKVLSTLRQGASVHIMDTIGREPASAAVLVGIVPGFAAEGDAETRGQYLAIYVQRLAVSEVLELADKVKAAAAT